MKILSALLLVAACGCSNGETEARNSLAVQEAPIMGGYKDIADKAVVGIVHLGNWGLGICSGTLIAPNLVLTAHHCVAPINNGEQGVNCAIATFGATYSPTELYVSTDSALAQHGDWYESAEVFVPPGGDAVCGNDLALIILTEPVGEDVTRPRIPRVDIQVDGGNQNAQLPGGETYSAIGFGNINDQSGSGTRRRRDDLQAACVGNSCPFYVSAAASEWMGEAGVCSGDSGGPAVDAVGRVIGVASRGGAGCSFPIYGGIFLWADWMKEIGVEAATRGGYAPLKWSLGVATDPAFQIPMGSPCINGFDCESLLCWDGYCSRRCQEDAPCAPGFFCSPDTFECRLVPVGGACETDNNCAPAGTCYNGTCSRACNAALPCPDAYFCAGSGVGTDGMCQLFEVGASCQKPADCDSNACLDGRCTRHCNASEPCPEGYGCNVEVGGFCQRVDVTATCQGDADCGGGICKLGACTFGCAADADCPPTHQCVEGLCAPVPVGGVCAANIECGPGVCSAGVCARTCSDNAECAAGWSCDRLAGTCTLLPVGQAECAVPSDCETGFCTNGQCTRQCAADAPCPSGWACAADLGVCEAIIPPGEDAPGCQTSGSRPSAPWMWLGLLLVPLAVRRRAHKQV